VDGPWPLVRLIGDDDGGVAVIALNSARPNPVPPWRSSGRIPDEQLEALGEILRRPEIGSRFVFVVTHYAPRLWDGRPDTPNHRLVNAEEFLETCAGLERGAILCGHVHRTFRVQIPGIGPEIFCAGSATMHELEGFWMFDLERGGLSARRGRWTGHGYEVDAPEDSDPGEVGRSE
jgi:3',5'-cyclic AMP phosphodiesterase CpdA